MPRIQVPGAELDYYLVAYDAKGCERADDSGGLASREVTAALSTGRITDLFVVSHGWKGDVPAAKDQYARWITAMERCENDRERARQRPGGFEPLIVGFHWPSLPFGDEELTYDAVTFGAVEPDIDALVNIWAERTADTPQARAALATILAAVYAEDVASDMSATILDAYRVLGVELALGNEGPAGAPGHEGDGFDAAATFDECRRADAVTFGSGGPREWLLAPLQQLSFWTMKNRARTIGETALHGLLAALAKAAPSGRAPRVHLVGHSFGCIVVSAGAAGAPGSAAACPPAQSLVLIQGALSLWAYCDDIPCAPGEAGYFRPLISGRRVAGPIVTTRSSYDTAVGRFYPLGSGLAGQVTFAPDELPRYGGLGAFGIQGGGLQLVDRPIAAVHEEYGFTAGRVYNLESSRIICEGSGASGAHSDIAKPEVAHAVWEAALA